MKSIIFTVLFFLQSITIISGQPYVIIVSFDGFRWDYIYRDLTPNLDRVIEEGVHAASLVPTFPTKTFPNHISILTGMYPENHGIISNYFENPFNGKQYRIGNSQSIKESEWYLAEFFWETARRNNIVTASYFWPGSEIDIESRRPNYFKEYEHDKPYRERIDTVITWLQLPHTERPRFITVYFHDTDSFGHEYGPESEEIDASIARVDSLAGYLEEKLGTIGLRDSVNLIFVSDHGMSATGMDRIVNIDSIMKGIPFEIHDTGPFATLNPDPEYIDTAFERLKQNESHYTVYKKEEIPGYLHYSSHPFIPKILVIADPGWLVETNAGIERKISRGYKSLGNHGYENYYLDMHGLFVAKGPVFKVGLKTSSLQNIDIYPLLCKIFNIEPRSNIDGRIERIEYILNQ